MQCGCLPELFSIFLLVVACDCGSPSTNSTVGSDADYLRQTSEYQRQLDDGAKQQAEALRQSALAAKQLVESQRQFEESAKQLVEQQRQAKIFDKQSLDIEKQADRQDQILKANEERNAISPK